MATGMKQYLRKWSLIINGQPFIDGRDGHQLRCVFDIDVFPQNTLTLADIQLYNLSKSTAIQQRSDVILSAGYENSFDTIFIGTVTNIFKERRGPDLVLRLLCRSGIASQRGLMNGSYMPGARITDVLIDAARSWPLYLELDPSQFDDSEIFPSGYTPDSDIPTTLNELARMFRFEWVQDRGSLVITRPNKGRSTTVFDINQFSGMVGMPEVNRGVQGLGVTVTSRINPYIRATSRINVQSEFSTYQTGNLLITEMAGDVSANGEYNVLRLRYAGDSHGEAWNMRIDGLRAGTARTEGVSGGSRAGGTGGLIWGARVSQDFRAKVREIAQRQNLDPNWYMAVMAFETGKTFSPAEKNKAGSGATGLIQFMPSTARNMGTSTQALSNMDAVQQLDYVEKYFQPYVGRMRNLGDMYMAVLWPAGVGKPDAHILWTAGSIQYTQNSGLDTNHDGTITRGEAVERVNQMAKEGQAHMA